MVAIPTVYIRRLAFSRQANPSRTPTLAQEFLESPAGEGTADVPGGGYGQLVYGTVKSAPEDFNFLIGRTFSKQGPFRIDNPEALQGHPGIFVAIHPNDIPQSWSSAFGRFQITFTNAQEHRFSDFSPAGQDVAAVTLLNLLHAVTPAMEGNLQQALRRMYIWQSMPGSSLKGRHISSETAQSVFQHALDTLPACK
jgi:hypothetical protein